MESQNSQIGVIRLMEKKKTNAHDRRRNLKSTFSQKKRGSQMTKNSHKISGRK